MSTIRQRKILPLLLAAVFFISLFAGIPVNAEAEDYLQFRGDQIWDMEEVSSSEPTLKTLATPNDPYFPNQWGMQATGMPEAWDQGLTGKGVTIGLIDTGVLSSHPDLKGNNMISGHNYLDNNRNTEDTEGHGTFVAGIIGAKRNNHIDIAGIAPEATIVTMKCFDGNKSIVSDAVKAIYACVDEYHCRILLKYIHSRIFAQTIYGERNGSFNKRKL